MDIRTCWIVTEGMAGTENQCIAVAEALGVDYTVKRIGLNFPYNHLCPFLLKTAPKNAITGIDWEEPAPDLILTGGRKAVPVALQFKKTSFITFIQDPKINPSHFDLVAVPMHDETRGDNVMVTTAAPNRITDQSLSQAKSQFDFSHLPQTKIAVLIGGNSKTHSIPHGFAHGLIESLLPYMNPEKYGFMVTVSRRTPPLVAEKLKDVFSGSNCIFWDGEGDNPYQAFLAYADYVLVTEDSTSMLSDALTTGKPTFRIPLDGGSHKFDRLYQNLKRRCLLRVFDGELAPYDYKPLNDAQKIADEIKKRFVKKAVSN